MATGGKDGLSENPRIGKVLRIPIEIVTEDESKVDETIEKLSKVGSKQGGAENKANIEKALDKTPLGDMVSMSKDQIGNIVSFGKNPSSMLLKVFLKKFARGAGAIALAFIIMEAIKFGLEYLTRDGMPWDRRFKRYIQKEIIAFLDRMFKAQLRGGFRTLITTTMGELRGGAGQVSGNLYALKQGTISQKIPLNQYAIPVNTAMTKGITSRRATMSGRFG